MASISITQICQELDKLLGMRNINLHLIGGSSPAKYPACGYGAGIIEAVIASAAAGVGPDNRPYPEYSPEYAKRKKKAGGPIRFLRGIESPGRTGGMLDPARFHFEIGAGGRLWLVWTSAGGKMDVYAEVHQLGLPLGKNGPRKQRMWLQVATARSSTAVFKGYQMAIDDLIMAWNAGRILGAAG